MRPARSSPLTPSLPSFALDKVIVAGDNRQLPPTEFFTKVLEAEQPSAGNEEALAFEAEHESSDLIENVDPQPNNQRTVESNTVDAESILTAFDRVLAGQGSWLRWHYRSIDERLIAVSNAYVYDGSLITFPAADSGSCLRHEVVPLSPGIKGGSNSPEAEVQRVVDLVIEHAKEFPQRTLGVITFGSPHTTRVQAAIDAALAADPTLDDALNGNEREPFFVKNIERVQGDERDSIILSVGYGKNPADGKLRLFWGPLLKEGGERRLNVAISRARASIVLVTSFEADDLAEDGHLSAGYQLMYQFVRYVASGGTELNSGSSSPTPLNPFEIDVRDRLESEGIKLIPQMGVGRFRIDFAVCHPNHPGRYVLAIETDGASYHSGHIARERDRLRQSLLETRGWTFHRIWSTDWFNDCEGEVQSVLGTYRRQLMLTDIPSESSIGISIPDAALAETTPVVPIAQTWSMAQSERTLRRPRLSPGSPIDDYTDRTLVALVLYVRSDGVLRTRDEEFTLLMNELGYQRAGHRIVARLTAAQETADRIPRTSTPHV